MLTLRPISIEFTVMLSLDQVNSASEQESQDLLDGLYEHSPWIARAALAQRPFRSLSHLKHAMVRAVAEAGQEAQLSLVRAHHRIPEEFAKIPDLNTAGYAAKFGFPFVLAVRGPRGTGVTRQEIIDTLERRLDNPADFELAENLRNIHRIAELRLNDKFGVEPTLGNLVWDWQEQLAEFSDPGYAQKGQLTVTYLTDAHRQAAGRIAQNMKDCGFDQVKIDAVGNVVGRYGASKPGAKTLLTGSHYDTVRNAGKHDGRLGIFTPMACVRELSRQDRRLPFDIEVIGFAEEEGQRYRAAFLGSGALTGGFVPAWLEQKDADGLAMREAMRRAGLPATLEAIASLRRDPADYLGFVEVHIEQGPVLNELNLPLGIVTSINGGLRYQCEVIGMASHAGTTPMDRRRDAATAAAELALYVERRAAADGDPVGKGKVNGSVGTVGMLNVPGGSINVVPGRCQFTLDLRAPENAQRDALARDVLAEFEAICGRRGVRGTAEETMRAAAAPSAPEWQWRWEQAVGALGVPLHRMPSGAGHDAMKLHEVMPQAMLFVRGQNGGISHNPLESTTSDDMQLAVEAFQLLLTHLAKEI